MDTPRGRAPVAQVAGGAALALAGGAAVALVAGDLVGSASPAAETVFTGLWVVGWVLVVWAVLVGGAAAVLLGRGLSRGRRPVLTETLLVVATVVVLAAVVVSHPVVGSGGGTG
ncbi:hypothetical protein [Cellulomonas endophytica]|uniref:hypothetical protein n=1 Tax=Cellulomonas endophytica TaxID=2494735 RepID=UPI0010128B37|nr:hypothetical protein [Cellulomonas endophytica]